MRAASSLSWRIDSNSSDLVTGWSLAAAVRHQHLLAQPPQQPPVRSRATGGWRANRPGCRWATAKPSRNSGWEHRRPGSHRQPGRAQQGTAWLQRLAQCPRRGCQLEAVTAGTRSRDATRRSIPPQPLPLPLLQLLQLSRQPAVATRHWRYWRGCAPSLSSGWCCGRRRPRRPWHGAPPAAPWPRDPASAWNSAAAAWTRSRPVPHTKHDTRHDTRCN